MDSVTIDFNGYLYPVKRTEIEKISNDNLELIKNFDLQNKREGLTENTRHNYIQFLILLAKKIPKQFKSITGDELLKFTDEAKVTNNTRMHYIIFITKFFKWLYHSENPELIKDLPIPKPDKIRKKHSEMLTEDEIQLLIDVCPEVQHKALIAVLYDSACRVSEITNLKRCDISCNGTQWILSVNGKTDIRDVPISISCKYFVPWFTTYHPAKNDDQAPIFFSMSHFKKYEKLGERQLSITGVWYILQQARRQAGITKKIHPHIFRHSRLSWLADHGMVESDMRYYAGWSDQSTMPSTYIHNNPKKLGNKINAIQGISTNEEKPQPTILIGKTCPRCNTENDVHAEYCKKCWLPINFQASKKEVMIMEFLRSEMYQSDKSQLQEFDLEYLANKYNQFVKESHRENRKQVKVIQH